MSIVFIHSARNLRCDPACFTTILHDGNLNDNGRFGSNHIIPDSSIASRIRCNVHSEELLRCRRIFSFTYIPVRSLQKCSFRLAFHPL